MNDAHVHIVMILESISCRTYNNKFPLYKGGEVNDLCISLALSPFKMMHRSV